MRKLFLHIILLLSLAACRNKAMEKPVLLNKEKIISVPGDSFSFQSNEKNWQAVLLSFTQPVPLQIDYTSDGFILQLQHEFGITEGPAHIILSKNNQHFIYEVNLQNESYGSITEKDYRSPKTVNPDSSLVLHQMIHSIDEWRNLVYTNQSLQYFSEELLLLAPTAGTFRAQKEKPITAFYVQPGSATAVNVNAVYNKAENVFEVTAGPLKDKYNNTVANGTTVAFIYTDGQNHYRMEAALQNGTASVKIPSNKKTYSLYAKVNETISNTIQLIAR